MKLIVSRVRVTLDDNTIHVFACIRYCRRCFHASYERPGHLLTGPNGRLWKHSLECRDLCTPVNSDSVQLSLWIAEQGGQIERFGMCGAGVWW